MFRDFVRYFRELDLYGRELLVGDGTRIKAVNNVNRNFTQAKLERVEECEERLERYLRQMDEADNAGGDAVVGSGREDRRAPRTPRDLGGIQEQAGGKRSWTAVANPLGLVCDVDRQGRGGGLQISSGP